MIFRDLMSLFLRLGPVFPVRAFLSVDVVRLCVDHPSGILNASASSILFLLHGWK